VKIKENELEKKKKLKVSKPKESSEVVWVERKRECCSENLIHG
jgi:hypothetical protein